MARRLKAHDTSKATRHKPAPVETRNIAHPTVWKTAMRIAENKQERIVVESYGCVTVTL